MSSDSPQVHPTKIEVPRSASRRRLIALAVFAVVLIGIQLYDPLQYKYTPGQAVSTASAPVSFEKYYNQRLAESRAVGVRPGNEERLVRAAPGKTEYAILFIHGFGASRAEGEAVFDQLGRELGANVYYARLRGHGANAEDHASVEFGDYLNTVEDAMAMMPQLGEKIIVGGSSTGALLAAYLAARHPETVYATIMSSPLFEFKDPKSAAFTLPGGMLLINTLFGEVRDANWSSDPEKRKQPGYEDYWLVTQYYSALRPLGELREYIIRDHFIGAITRPSLLLYYYADEERQDQVVDVAGNLEHFAQFGHLKGGGHSANRAVAIADGNHILMSEYVRTDKKLILQAVRDFLKAIQEAGATATTPAVR